jgi:NUMOD4 motif
MREYWKDIEGFPDYSVSDLGRIRTNRSGRILVTYETQSGLVQVGMMKHEDFHGNKRGKQFHRSVPLLVAKAFIVQPPGPFDTPINLDGNRHNNRVDNLAWRPRWFAVRYNKQFRRPYPNSIFYPLQDKKSGEICSNSFECAKCYGLLEEDVVLSVLNNTFVWPTYQQFRVLES